MKRKFSLLINIATLCLCVCTIAIGVYSAKTASLNIGGMVGFVAHNCKVELSGSIVACATSEDLVRTTKTIGAVTIGETDSSYALNLDTVFGGAMQFSDMFTDGQEIVLTLNIKNTSAFAITAKANMPTIVGENIQSIVTLDTTEITESTTTDLEIDGTTTLVITLNLTNTDTSFTTEAKISGTLFNFEKKYVEDTLSGTWVFNDSLSNIMKFFAYDMNFASNNLNFGRFVATAGAVYYRVNMDDIPGIAAFSLKWTDEAYKTIIITSKLSEVTDGDNLLTWLQANAKKQGANNTQH